MKERIAVQTSLLGIANKAKSDKRHRFHNLYKLRGYYNYYGVNGNRASLDEFFYHVRRISAVAQSAQSAAQLYLGRLH